VSCSDMTIRRVNLARVATAFTGTASFFVLAATDAGSNGAIVPSAPYGCPTVKAAISIA
jgi:hypothetical protein